MHTTHHPRRDAQLSNQKPYRKPDVWTRERAFSVGAGVGLLAGLIFSAGLRAQQAGRLIDYFGISALVTSVIWTVNGLWKTRHERGRR